MTVFAMGSTVLIGCATARVVKLEPGNGGIVALHEGLFGDAHEKANDLMRANCSGRSNVLVLEEEEAVIGKKIHTDRYNHNDSFFGRGTSDSESTENIEWRIRYRCKKLARKHP